MERKDRICYNCGFYDTDATLCRKTPTTHAKKGNEWCGEGVWAEYDDVHNRWQSVSLINHTDFEKAKEEAPVRATIALEAVSVAEEVPSA